MNRKHHTQNRPAWVLSAAVLAVVQAWSGAAGADQVIADDLITVGSICVGFDCVDGESFGFDTFRLKENNLRIKFDDTSSSAGFPAMDWQLTANDSNSGGLNRFSIEDVTDAKVPFTIEGNAPTNAFYLDDSGRLGLGTSAPVLDLHLLSSDTPATRLEQDSSGGYTAQTWDVAGNEANFFVRDVTGGSKLPFRIRPGAPTSSIDISASGKVGIGTPGPESTLHLASATPQVRLHHTGRQMKATLGYNGSDTQARLAIDFVAVNNAPYMSVDLFRASPTTVANSRFVIYQPGTANEKFSVDADDGNVAIAGKVFVNGTQVHPDYVFEPDYPLMPLSELESFVTEKRHLPGIPSAAEAKNGYDLIGMQLKLLEKTEEQALYILELEKRIKALEGKIARIAEAGSETR